MLIDLPSIVAFGGGIAIAMILSGKLTLRGLQAAQQIVREGHVAEGRVTKVWRPPVAGGFPRIHFEFTPSGSPAVVQGVHTDRRLLLGSSPSLPAVGTQVTVRYLPKDPRKAVIARLVSRFTN